MLHVVIFCHFVPSNREPWEKITVGTLVELRKKSCSAISMQPTKWQTACCLMGLLGFIFVSIASIFPPRRKRDSGRGVKEPHMVAGLESFPRIPRQMCRESQLGYLSHLFTCFSQSVLATSLVATSTELENCLLIDPIQIYSVYL